MKKDNKTKKKGHKKYLGALFYHASASLLHYFTMHLQVCCIVLPKEATYINLLAALLGPEILRQKEKCSIAYKILV